MGGGEEECDRRIGIWNRSFRQDNGDGDDDNGK